MVFRPSSSLSFASSVLSAPLVSVLLGSLVLVGCASGPTQWVSSTKPAAEFARDQEFCQVEAKAHVQRQSLSESSVDLTGLASVFRLMEERSINKRYQADLDAHAAECLKLRGWNPKP